MKKSSPLKILLRAIAFIFLFQALSEIVIIPIKPIISFLGQTEDPLNLFFSGFFAGIYVFIGSSIIEILYSIGFRRESGFISQRRIFIQGKIAFITIWLTFASYGILSMFGVISNVIISERLLNLYLFWFLFINSFISISVKKSIRPKDQFSSSDLIEKNRINWFSHITGLNKADEFRGEKGEILYKQTWISNIGHLVKLIIVILILRPVLFLTSGAAFLNITVDPPELAHFIKIMFGFIFFMINLWILYLVGLVLSKGITIYKNCIEVPLPTISDTSVFTLLLPRSSVVLGFNDIVSYKLEKRKRRKSNLYYLALFKLNMKNGDVVVVEPTMFNTDKFEKALIAALGEKNKIDDNNN